MNRAIASAALATLLVAPAAAVAGDYAAREILGFSPDGGYFAFEEYGVLDGSGWPYSNIFVVDTANDSWVAGTPIRVRTENEAAILPLTRAQSRRKANVLLKKLGIGTPGEIVASNPATELSADPNSVTFRTNPYLGSDDRVMTLTLSPIPFDAAGECENLGPIAGFRLVLSGKTGGARLLHEDTKLPSSRGCAQEYAISDVVALQDQGATEAVLAVLVSVYTQGFEGPDRRFLAVTSRIGLPLN